jgi:hypothetical protein
MLGWLDPFVEKVDDGLSRGRRQGRGVPQMQGR